MQKQSLQILSKTVSEKTGCTKLKASVVMQGHESQLRKMDSIHAIKELTIHIPLIAKEYGARFDLSPNVVQEAIRLILKKFGKLGLIEIREAYREFASGETKILGAEMYGGEFNVANLGKVLTAYCENRSKVLAELLKQKSEAETELIEAEKHKSRQKEFDKSFPKLVMEKRLEFEKWSDVPVFWYKIILSKGWISFEEGEANEIFEEAKSIAKIELRKKELERSQVSIQELFKMKIPTEEELSKIIARQLTIFKKVVQDRYFSPIEKH